MTQQIGFTAQSGGVAFASRCRAIIQSCGDAVAPWLDVAARVWLAKVFLVGAAISAMRGAFPAMSGSGLFVAALNALVASPFGLLTQFICPVLLMIGLGSRFAAAPLLIQVLLLHSPGGLTIAHPIWAVLLGWIIVFGSSLVSIDALIAEGLDSSAIPGARTVRRAFAWVTRRVGPWFLLGLRFGIASALLVNLVGSTDGLGTGLLADWIVAPGWTASLPQGFAAGLAVLLLTGLGTRFCALILILIVPIGQAGMSVDDRLYWTLLLGILACRGSGPLALDPLVAMRLSDPNRRLSSLDLTLPHVVILGGGFGGVAAARGLKHAACRITLVDRNNHHVFQPLLYQVATAGLAPTAIATPIRSLFRSQANLRVLLAEVRGISAESREVILDGSRLAFDYLVIATGARHSYFGRDDWAHDAPGLKRIEDATQIRRRLLIGFERAESADDPGERARWMTFVIVGGGPTGVELAGALAELAQHGLTNEYRTIDPASARIVLVQSADRLLPTFPAVLSGDARDQLVKLKVEVLTGAKVEQIDADGVVVGGARIEARTVLWAAGVAASPAADWLGAAADRAGRVIVGPDLKVGLHPTIFAIGDTASSAAWKGGAVPGLAPAAKQGGAYVAKVVRASLRKKPAPGPFCYRHPGSLATIGRRTAVAEFGPLRLRGAPAWWLWGLVHILFLTDGRSQASVILAWVWAYITDRRGSRLITDAGDQSVTSIAGK
nr:NAD(P)/FAD-dependent oxidoreductase [Lichenihabitans psoromatis]